jgi:excinuclease UvrABC ATPase subunit
VGQGQGESPEEARRPARAGDAGGAGQADRFIEVRGARTHNLRGIDVEIPLEKCTVVVGPSGSGKSSLAFGTIHAAAHAAYLEGMSSYSRFTEARIATPDVDMIHGLRPTLSLAQGYGGRSSRSTVGTVTDAMALLRLLFSRLGSPQRTAGQLSFNNPEAVCPVCKGAGIELSYAEDRLIDGSLTLSAGAIQHRAWKVGGRYWNILAATGKLPLDTPVDQFTDEQRGFLLHAPSIEVSNDHPGFVQRFTYQGIVPRLEKRIGDSRGLDSRSYDLSFFAQRPCSECRGTRLCREAREVRIGDVQFQDVLVSELARLAEFLRELDAPVAGPVRQRMLRLIERMIEMGLGHLTLHRPTSTLSGGELRRVRIAHQLTSQLTGLTYVVDEASAGLHHEEGRAVYASLRHLCAGGDTVLLVDHADGARAIADHVIEMGPGGGRRGGQVMWAGPARDYNGVYGLFPVIDREPVPVDARTERARVSARSHNLRGETVSLPLNRFVVLAGPSGSGKSSLALDIAAQVPGSALLSQRDIGGSVRSVIATYLNVFDPIRKMFGKASGRPPGDFSFNGAGACPRCGGWGFERTEMQFLEDVTSLCEECQGRRYRPELLTTLVHGLSVADVLDLTIDEALAIFKDEPAVRRPLDVAAAVGIGHLVIGQSTDTLSGGEGQRLRISAEVAVKQRPVLLLDEPTRGLGFAEIAAFIALVDRILGEGRSVIAIEHNLAVIAAADWIIELGPGGGEQGGRVMAQGTVDDIRRTATITSRALRRLDSSEPGPGQSPGCGRRNPVV